MTDVLATTRCPQCVALVRPGQPWCTLCHADLRPAPEPAAPEPAAPEPTAPDEHVLSTAPAAPEAHAPDPLTDPLTDAVPIPSGKHARHAARPAAGPAAPGEAVVGAGDTISDSEIEAMLAQLALQTGAPLGGVASRFDSRSAKVALAVGVGLGAVAFLLVGAFIVAAIFG